MINIATGSLTNFRDLGNVCNLLAEYEQQQSGSVTICPPVTKHMVIFRVCGLFIHQFEIFIPGIPNSLLPTLKDVILFALHGKVIECLIMDYD